MRIADGAELDLFERESGVAHAGNGKECLYVRPWSGNGRLRRLSLECEEHSIREVGGALRLLGPDPQTRA